MSFQKT